RSGPQKANRQTAPVNLTNRSGRLNLVYMMQNTNSNVVGEYVRVGSWKIQGLVVAQRPATLGKDPAIEVCIQPRPTDRHPRWYRLEPTEFICLYQVARADGRLVFVTIP